MEFLSTTSLANELDVPANELFGKFKLNGWIERKGDKWILTDLGKQRGGQVRNNPKFGDYIVWPENISLEGGTTENKPKLLSSTVIGKNFNISSQRLNLILSELGLIEKKVAGWAVTKLGKSLGGKQFENDNSGGRYVLWPESILENKSLKEVFSETPTLAKEVQSIPIAQQQDNGINTQPNFREKFPATLRTKDGHYVRSRAEVIIDNALYDYKLAHAYERKLPVEEEVYCDFFIPTENVYIEYWGMENNAKYMERKEAKLAIYKKYDFKLIELNDDDINNLDDHLPRKLLQFEIKVFG